MSSAVGAPRTGAGWLAAAPALTVATFALPIAAGLAGTLAPAFGYLPAIGGHAWSLDPWRELVAWPGFASTFESAGTSGEDVRRCALSSHNPPIAASALKRYTTISDPSGDNAGSRYPSGAVTSFSRRPLRSNQINCDRTIRR